MALFEAYFDESGTHDDAPFTFVAGLIAKKSSWLSISNQWQSVLDKFQVESCHATDLNNFQGEFSGWDEEKRRAFYGKFFSVLSSESGLISIGCGVERKVFNEIVKDYPKPPLTPYLLCAEYCLAHTGGIAMGKKHWPPVAVVFEFRQQHSSPTFEHTMSILKSPKMRKLYNINSITWMAKKNVVPLQFADMFVYELYREHEAKIQPAEIRRPVRYPLRQFAKYTQQSGELLSMEKAREYIEMTQAFNTGRLAEYLQRSSS